MYGIKLLCVFPIIKYFSSSRQKSPPAILSNSDYAKDISSAFKMLCDTGVFCVIGFKSLCDVMQMLC